MTTEKQITKQRMKSDARNAKFEVQVTESGLASHVAEGITQEVSVQTQENNGRRLTIGDSRTVGMACSKGKGIKYKRIGNKPAKVDEKDLKGNRWFAEEGKGLAWMQNNISTIKERAQDCDQIVINLGANDIGANPTKAAKNYIAYINQLAKEWKAQGKEVIFTSVNPVDDNKCAIPKNKDIEQFNKLVKEGLSSDVMFVDTYSKLKGNSQYKLVSDGLHCADYAFVDASMEASIEAAQMKMSSSSDVYAAKVSKKSQIKRMPLPTQKSQTGRF